MKITVEFEECLKDSPRFRATIEEVEGDVGELESKLDKLVKLCIGMIDAGKAYNTANKQFVNGIRELAASSTKDEVIESSLTTFAESLQEMINYHTILFDQAQRSIKTQLLSFVKEDLRKFKEAKKQFDKVSEEKEAALNKNAQAPRNKQHEVEEATNILTATRKCFRHIVLDYVLQINVLQSKRRSEILKSMLSFMYAHLTFFHQGYDLFSELQPLMKQLGGQLDLLVVDAAKEKRDMEQKHSTIQQKDFSNDDTKLEYNVDADNGIAMEGYLFKRASNAFKTWNRRWFSIQNNQLVYQKKFKDNPTVVVEDLRLCTVKHCEDIERRFCFEVVSPTKSCIMQADSEKLRQAWIKAVQNSIATAFREQGEDAEKLDRKSSTSTGSLDSGGEPKERSLKGESALQRVMVIGGNACCCDCGQPDPRWASINLGITLCIQCSGIHRSLGVHFSKVRSLTLDSWEPELLKLMCELGNGVINQIYEAGREELGAMKPKPTDPRRWFSIQNNQLVYQKKFKDNPTVVVEDLRLCTVKHCEDIERRFCFEVVSPTKSCIMQADSEKLRQAWIKAVQNSIATAFREQGEDAELDRKSSTSTGSLDSGGEPKERSLKGESALQRVMVIGGNACCCDCGQPDPRWASINLGITLCIQCSGIHRSLGVHFSKVRSLTLDSWEPELLKLMCELGNGVINQIYEAGREELGAMKPKPTDPRQEIEAYIRAKYVDRRFVQRPSNEELRAKVVSLAKREKKLSGSTEHLPPRPPPPTPKLRPSSNASGQSAAAKGLKARRDSLFCPDELDSLFSYFDTSAKLRSIRSADSGIQNSAEGSREMLANNSLAEAEAAEAPPMAMPATLPPPSPCKELVVFSEPKEYSSGLQLYWASCARSLPDMAEALAHGAEVNWVNTDDDKRTPLIMAVQGGSLVTCEFLLQNAGNVNQQDALGRGPLHHATILGHTGQVCLFLKRGANQNAADIDAKTPLSMAVDAANADIVTLLRLAKMNEEMREAEGPYMQSGDETYQDIFQDFSQMASNDPEKLNRYQQYDSQQRP
ncbi:arf-GAP with coiled-coil, ANK repeat and PH domain-containing protein 2-like isoform X2 [Oncorhynchus masou masou]|uniref:arf-GAP with coiled-coil, ANK repeat and PH domain-containing protein 2-like isoform X2 n=1 Tax=Oncorhynchus masou masou TaxID=90313 RepID=UPI00318329AA